MSNARRVASNALYLGATNALYLGVALVFTKMSGLYLGKVGYGEMGFVFSLLSFLEAVAKGGTSTVLTQRVAQDPENAVVYWWPSLLMHASFGAFFLIGGELGAWLFNGDPLVLWATLFAALTSLIKLLSETAIATLRGMDRMGPEFRSTFIERTLYLVLFIGVYLTFPRPGGKGDTLYNWAGFLAIFWINIFTQAVQSAWLLWPLWRKLKPTFSLPRHALAELYHASSPLWIGGLLISLHWRLESLLLPKLASKAELGIYLAAYRLPDILRVVPWMICMAIFPALSRQVEDTEGGFRETYVFLVKLLTLLALPCVIVFVLMPRLIVGTLLTTEFSDAATPLILLSLAIPLMFLNVLFTYGAVALEKQRWIVRINAVTILFHILAALVLIPRYGAVGGAMSYLCGEIMLALLCLLATHREIVPLSARSFLGLAALLSLEGIWAACFFRQPKIAFALTVITYFTGIWLFGVFSSEERKKIRSLFLKGRSFQAIGGAGGRGIEK
jgi:O-antigen/teichoic acid export membrane protein